MKKSQPSIPARSDEFTAAVDALALMLSQDATRAFLAQPNLRVVEIRNQDTGQLTYSFRSPEDDLFAESATPKG